MSPCPLTHMCTQSTKLPTISSQRPFLTQLKRINISCLQADGEHTSLTTYRTNSAESSAAPQHQTAP